MKGQIRKKAAPVTSSDIQNDEQFQKLRQAMVMHQNGRLDEAESHYAELLDTAPDHAQGWRLRGILARARGDMTLSFECLNEAIGCAPEDPDPLCEMGLTHMAVGDLKMADEALRAALDLDETYPKALANLGALLQYRGHIHEAITLQQNALAQDPDDMEVRCNLAKALADTGALDDALDACQKAADVSFGHPLPLAIEGSILCDAGRYDAAVPLLVQAISRDPGNDMALVNLAFAHTMQGNRVDAERALRDATLINPSNARGVSDLVNVLVARGHYDEAIDLGESFLTHHPGERMVLASYAYALHDAGRDDEAKAIFDLDTMVLVNDLDVPEGYADHPAFHHDLAAALQQHSSLMMSPASKSTYGGGQTGELDFDDDPALKAFEAMIKSAIQDNARVLYEKALPEMTRMSQPPDYWSLRAWGTVLESGGHQTPHMHPLGWMSGVYYVQLPKDMGTSGPHAGFLEFGRPPERYAVSSPAPTKWIEPREGRLVTFPSYMYHQTEPFTSDAPRISVAFDVMPAGSIGVF